MVQSNPLKNKPNYLCKISDLPDPSSKSFQIKIGRKKTDIFIVRKSDQIFAYQNICPHAQAPLEWNPDEFLDDKKEKIICAMHGARFSIKDGSCLSGPCGNSALIPVELIVLNDEIFYQ